MYTRFADVYDRLMADFDYDAWAEHYLALAVSALGRPPARVCECACGTGSISARLAAKGLLVVGVDRSADMLRQAQAKARAFGVLVPFLRQDMRELQLARPVDAIFCPCDGVNYLLTEPDVAKFFQAANAALRPGGALAFDVSSEHKLKSQAETGLFYEDHDDLTYFFLNRWRESTRTVQMELSFFLRQKDGLYQRFDECQTQRAHTAAEMSAALTAAGFSDIHIYGGMGFEPPRADEARIHIIAVKGAQHVK